MFCIFLWSCCIFLFHSVSLWGRFESICHHLMSLFNICASLSGLFESYSWVPLMCFMPLCCLFGCCIYFLPRHVNCHFIHMISLRLLNLWPFGLFNNPSILLTHQPPITLWFWCGGTSIRLCFSPYFNCLCSFYNAVFYYDSVKEHNM